MVRLAAGVLPDAHDRASIAMLPDRPVILFTRTAEPLGTDFIRRVLCRARRCVTVVRSTIGRLQLARYEQDIGTLTVAVVGSLEEADALLLGAWPPVTVG